ncbi:MAG: hypothetical protein WDM87_16600 [Terracidiphilus sp.]
MWTAYGPADPAEEEVDDLKRGLSAEAQGEDADAIAAYGRALAAGQGDMRPLDSLAAACWRERGMTEHQPFDIAGDCFGAEQERKSEGRRSIA